MPCPQPPPRTCVGVETLAVEHLCLLDVADATMVAGVGMTGVVAALAHPAAIQHIAAFLPQVVHLVVHIQEADAALQAGCSRGTICHPEGTEDKVGGGFVSEAKNAEDLQASESGCAPQRGIKRPPKAQRSPNPQRPSSHLLEPASKQRAAATTDALPAADAVTPRTAVQHPHSRSHLVLRRSPDEEVCVEVEPVGARRALPADVGFAVDRQHAAAAVAVHH